LVHLNIEAKNFANLTYILLMAIFLYIFYKLWALQKIWWKDEISLIVMKYKNIMDVRSFYGFIF